jgi:hypothetical protein
MRYFEYQVVGYQEYDFSMLSSEWHQAIFARASLSIAGVRLLPSCYG